MHAEVLIKSENYKIKTTKLNVKQQSFNLQISNLHQTTQQITRLMANKTWVSREITEN